MSKYVVAISVGRHMTAGMARFLIDRVVFVHGPLRELVTDGPLKMVGGLKTVVEFLQAEQTNRMHYRPQLMGLVERFGITGNDMAAICSSKRLDKQGQLAAVAHVIA